MLRSIVVELKAAQGGLIAGATGQAVHGFFLHELGSYDPSLSDAVHGKPYIFTVSPLMGLPLPQEGIVRIPASHPVWFRLAALNPEISNYLQEGFTKKPPDFVHISGISWRVDAVKSHPVEHPWCGCAESGELLKNCSQSERPSSRWGFEFLTPTSFHYGTEEAHLPFPLPALLVKSLARAWNAVGPVPLLPDEAASIGEKLMISNYQLRTVPARTRSRLMIGCVGQCEFDGKALTLPERGWMDLLASLAFWSGVGHRAAQGFGMARWISGDHRN